MELSFEEMESPPHVIYDKHGNGIPVPDGSVHKVLVAEIIHHGEIDDEAVAHLPSRFWDDSIRSKLMWFGSLCLCGTGLFIEAYMIITTGQITLIWENEYPECWLAGKSPHCPNVVQCCGTFKDNPLEVNGTCNLDMVNSMLCTSEGNYPDQLLCNKKIDNSISYSSFAGIMLGMLTFGYVCDWIGHTKAGVLTSLLQLVGVTVMAFYDSPNISRIFLYFAIFFGIFGWGIGGEYPITAHMAADIHAESLEDAKLDTEELRKLRITAEIQRAARLGETVSIVFAMQGIGALLGSVVLLVLIYFSGQSRPTCSEYLTGINVTGTDPRALNTVWRTFYFIGGIFIFLNLIYRFLVLDEGASHATIKARQKQREAKFGRGVSNKLRILWYYLPRLIGTGGSWFVWDITFYGLKLYSGPIFNAINPGGSLFVQNGYLLLNNFIALLGYYCAASVIDIPAIGRQRLQMMSFGVSAIIFLISSFIFTRASSSVLMALYFLISFFGQFGTNVTTYVMAAETYPTELRGTGHGISAFSGKCGALVATVLFANMKPATIFLVCGLVSILGFVFTFVFSVDLTRVSFAEHDAQLELFLEGRPKAYKGLLNHPRHLSNWEIWTGRHGKYKPGWAAKLIKKEMKKAAVTQSTGSKEDSFEQEM